MAKIKSGIVTETTVEEKSPHEIVFVRCTFVGPDGKSRRGWEMWLEDHCFGRADSKELLLASYTRLHEPPASFHWREVSQRKKWRRWNKQGQRVPT